MRYLLRIVYCSDDAALQGIADASPSTPTVGEIPWGKDKYMQATQATSHGRAAPLRRLRRLAIGALASAAILTGASTAGAIAASASTVWPSHSSYTHNNSYSYSEMFNADHTGLVIANLYNNTTVYMRCWATGQNFYANYYSTKWFWVTLSSGASGWVPSGYVQDQAPVPGC
jgi:hypothetical protein